MSSQRLPSQSLRMPLNIWIPNDLLIYFGLIRYLSFTPLHLIKDRESITAF